MPRMDFVGLHEVVKSDAFVEPAALSVIKDPTVVPLLESSVFFSPFSVSSAHHGRTMEDPFNVVFTGEPLVDEHGDTYTNFTIKGALCALPSASYYDIEPSNVRVNGMLDASTFERCKAASTVLRKEGVLTEWPILHMRPKRFPDGEKDVTLQAFRRMVYDNFIDTQKAAYDEGFSTQQFNYASHHGNSIISDRQVSSFGRVGLIGEALSEIQFSVMYRAGLSPIRLWELGEHGETGTLSRHISNAIVALQARKPEHFACWPEIEVLNAKSDEDQQKYLVEILPKIMGENLARFHNAGCYHKYLHGGNWSLAGEIVDLDSVRSDELDGVDGRDYTVLDKLSEVFQSLDHFMDISVLAYLMQAPKMRPGETLDIPEKAMQSAFKSSYFCERYLASDLTKLEKITLTSHLSKMPSSIIDWDEPEFVSPSHPDVVEYFVQSGIDLTDYDPDKLLDNVLKGLTPVIQRELHSLFKEEEVEYIPEWFNISQVVLEEGARLLGVRLLSRSPTSPAPQ